MTTDSSNPNRWMDVHLTDRHLKFYNIRTTKPLEIKNKLFLWLLTKVNRLQLQQQRQHNMQAQQRFNEGVTGLRIVITDTQLRPNYDDSNEMWADDILAEICEKLISIKMGTEEQRDRGNDDPVNEEPRERCAPVGKREDWKECTYSIIGLLLEQMSDMIRTNGTCPSGRVTRLIQVYHAVLTL